MGSSKTRKALADLKYRVKIVEENLEFKSNVIYGKEVVETLKVKDEIKILIEAYEKQIELNKKQNIKIKNQRGLLRVLQQKQGEKNGKANI